jgi:hypothetical protein
MTKSLRKLVVLAAVLLATWSALAIAQSDILPVDEVRAGMSGIVKTTRHGTEVVDVKAKVLGVLLNALGPGVHVILVTLTDESVQFEGVANGMSGSPFYIDGKLVGALFSRIGFFSKEPIAGVTPIGDMIATQFGGRGKPTVSLDYSLFWGGDPLVRELAHRLGRELKSGSESDRPKGQEYAGGIRPLAVNLIHSGLEPVVVERFKPIMSELGFELSTSGASGGPVQVEGALEPGMPVMAELIGGDMSLGAVGTLTHVSGNKFWAFGHPFFNLGPVRWPLRRAELVKIFPAIDGSFYITNTGQQVGAIIQDRAPGLFGELGAQVEMVPLKVTVKHGGEQVVTYNYQLARDFVLTPILIDMAVSQSLAMTQRQYGEMSVAMSGTIAIEGFDDVKVDNLYTGVNIAGQIGALPAAIYAFINSNEFTPVKITSLDLTLDFVEEQRIATLERAWLTKTEVKEGDEFKLIMELKPRRGRTFTLEEDYYLRIKLQPGVYKMTVGNGAAINEQENQLIQGDFQIRDVDHMVHLINSLRPSNKLYAQVFRSEEGLYYEGDFFPDLPPSALTVMKANKGGDSFIRLLGTVLDERRMDTDYYVNGVRKLEFTVRP